MHCPNCQHLLKKESFHGVQIDYCTSCKGLWFDRGELRKAKDNTDENLRWLDFYLFEEKEGKYIDSSSKRKCPIDATLMVSQKYAESGILINKCLQCQGVWLDYHEFEKIVEYLHKKIYSETAAEYSIDAAKQLLEIGKGHENKKSEIKDFLAVLKLLETRFVVEHPIIIQINKFIHNFLPF